MSTSAKLLAHRREVATFESPHPTQWAGVALIWTPGHTDGNHSLCVNTPDGVWITSENGIALDNWQPDRSKIPGLRSHARRFGREVIPNANTLEDALDQYDSMVKEKTLADPKHFWPVRPTYAHGLIEYGEIIKPDTPRAA